MSARQPGRSLYYFGTGILDQILLSGANFITGLVMIRYTSDVSYGQIVLAQSALLLLMSAQAAWLSGPTSAVAPSKPPELRALMIGSLAASQTRFLRRLALCLLVIPVAAGVTGIWSANVALAVAATVLAGWTALQREYRRTTLLIYSRPHDVLLADVVYVVILVSGILLALLLRPLAGPLAIAALSVAGWAGARTAHRMLAVDPGWVSGDAASFWQEIRHIGMWSTAGAVIYWLFGQSYNYVLAARLDLTAVTNINAARLVMAPVFVLMYGINSLLTATAANWLASFGLPRMLRRLAVLTLLVTAIDLTYFALAWWFRDWIVGDLLHKHIANQDRMLALWGCIALVFLPREVLQAALFALKRVQSMAWIIGGSALASLLTMWFGIARWGAVGVLIGQMVGECGLLAGLAALLWHQVLQRRAQP